MERIHIEDYPAIKAHLDKFWDKISTRSDKGDTPYNLRNCAYMDDFHKPKVIYPNMTKYLPFVYETEGLYTNQKCFIAITNTPAYLTAFFNSNLFKAIYKDAFPTLGEYRRELGKIFMETIVVKEVLDEVECEFDTLVREMQLTHSVLLSEDIEQQIFQIYDLTAEEIAWVNLNAHT